MNKLVEAQVLSEQETQELAGEFVQQLTTLSVRPVIYLTGELGAGKSVFVRAILRALGVTEAIKSPTYTLVEQYPLKTNSSGVTAKHNFQLAAHLDLYRLVNPEELYFIDFDAIVLSCDLLLIEWPDKGVGQLPSATHTVMIDYPASAESCARDIAIIQHE